MNTISALGWFLIICLAGLIISLNVGLLLSLRAKKSRSENQMLNRMGETLRKPWGKEESQLDELSQRIRRLQNKTPVNDQNETNPPPARQDR